MPRPASGWGYVMPGETLYVVNDPSKGSAQEQLEERIQNVNRDRRAATPWFVTMWDSIDVAGQSTADFDNPNNAPVIAPSEVGMQPQTEDNSASVVTPTADRAETDESSTDSESTDESVDGTLQDESSQNDAP